MARLAGSVDGYLLTSLGIDERLAASLRDQLLR